MYSCLKNVFDREQEQCNMYSSLCQQRRPRGSQVFYLLIVKICPLWKNICVDKDL